MDKIVNPCKLICKYDDKSVCIGCKRTRQEVISWPEYNDEEKKIVFKRIIERGGNPYEKKRYTF
ncbi:MAG: DUF1289 domain-containing protein [Bacteroidales bacterium]